MNWALLRDVKDNHFHVTVDTQVVLSNNYALALPACDWPARGLEGIPRYWAALVLWRRCAISLCLFNVARSLCIGLWQKFMPQYPPDTPLQYLVAICVCSFTERLSDKSLHLQTGIEIDGN